MKRNPILFYFIMTVLFACSPAGSALGQGRLADEAALLAKAREQGTVRVIVSFETPGLDSLLEASRSFKPPVPGVARSQEEKFSLRAADAALASAITTAATNVFGRLGLEEKIDYVFKTAPLAVMTVGNKELLTLAGGSMVRKVYEDAPVPLPDETTGVESVNDDYGQLSYGVRIINAPEAWDKGYDGSGWYVAVLDTGVRTSHEMFTGKNIAEACFSSNVEGFSTSLCPGEASEAEGPGSAVPPDIYGHGTHVSGIALGRQAGGSLRGVAPGADLMAIQVFSFISQWYDVGSYYSDQLKGLEYVYIHRSDYPIASVNMSLGGERYSDYCDSDIRKMVIDNLRAVGIPTVISNGNDGYCDAIGAPACISSAVAVGGSDYNDSKYSWNNWHPVMQDIFAPGVMIISAVALSDTDYASYTGTSMAAPHTAGAWAIFRQASPDSSVSEIEQVMEDTGKVIESGCDTEPGSGPRLDVAAAVNYWLAEAAVPTADAGPDQVVNEETEATLDGSGSVSNSGRDLTYVWVQTAGTEVALSDPSIVNPVFTTPKVGFDGETLTFELTVTDVFNNLTASDSVNVVVTDPEKYNPPTADAGPDQSVNSGTGVILDGSGSTSNTESGEPLTYAWIQTQGPSVVLSDATSVSPTWVAPATDGSSVFVFQLTVVDTYNELSNTDDVQVTVNHVDNSVDAGFLPVASSEGEIVGIKTEDGDSALVYVDPINPADMSEEGVRPNIVKYVFGTRIKCASGATVKVVFQLPQAAPENAGWYKYSADSGWSEYPVTFSDGRTIATITLTDGGNGDQDGSVNGMIEDPSGLGYNYTIVLPESSSSKNGCFLEVL